MCLNRYQEFLSEEYLIQANTFLKVMEINSKDDYKIIITTILDIDPNLMKQ